MKQFQGTPIAPGCVIGHTYRYSEHTIDVPKYSLAADDITSELRRLKGAIKRVRETLLALKKRTTLTDDARMMAILDVQILMLMDAELVKAVEKKLIECHLNIEFLVNDYFESMIKRILSSESVLLRERATDLRDLQHRLLHELVTSSRSTDLVYLNKPVILLAKEMSPTTTIGLNKRFVRGIILEEGGSTSHTAILTRALGVPTVFCVAGGLLTIGHDRPVIIDGATGVVICDPDEETIAYYSKQIKLYHATQKHLLVMSKHVTITKDKIPIALKANAQIIEDIKQAHLYNADGIGLFRSEFLFLNPTQGEDFPSEEQQYNTYRHILKIMCNRPVTIRTLDIGADKPIPNLSPVVESNPLLGWRGIRLCIDRSDIFKTQLKALYRAGVHGDLRIMLPFITSLSELESVLAIIKKVQESLRAKGIPYKASLPVGIMIETPAAALISDKLAKRVDFFSIGTNDLTQYTLAVDRDNDKVLWYYKPFHLSILRLIAMTVKAANDANIACSICGELAADPLATPLLLGLGLNELSINTMALGVIKETILLTDMGEAQVLAEEVLALSQTNDIIKRLKMYRESIFAKS